MKANLSRLRTLEQFERHQVPKKKFCMLFWGGKDSSLHNQNCPFSCLSRACSLGWAAMIPRFQRLGLKMHLRLIHTEISYRGKYGLYAGIEFFGLSFGEATGLFSSSKYNGKCDTGYSRITMTPFEHAEMLGRFIDCKVKNKMDDMVWDEKPVVES